MAQGSRTVAKITFVLCLALLGAALFHLLRPHTAAQVSSAEVVLRTATQSIPKLQTVAPASGHIELQKVTIDRVVPPPRIPATGRPAAPAQIVPQTIEQPRLVGATPQDAAAWNAAMQARQQAYQTALQESMQQLRAQPGQGSPPGDWSSQIVALIAAVTGLIGAITSLIIAVKAPSAKTS